MSGATRNVIALMGEPIIVEDLGVAAAAITPGHLVEINTSTGQIRKHATASVKHMKAFALERDEMGKEIDVDYAAGDTVKVGCFHSGQRVYAWIASGQDIEKGEFLESNGDGTLKVFSSGVIVGMAVEDNDNSAGPGASRLRIMVV